MNNDNYSLLTVRQSTKADEDKVTISVAIKKNDTGEVFTRQIAPDDKGYDDAIQLISDFQKGDIAQTTFSASILTAVLSRDIVGVQARVENSKAISAHVSIAGNKVYVDGVEINSILENEVLQLLQENPDNDDTNWLAFIHFVEKLYTNTSDYVRDQLYGWLDYQLKQGTLTITPDGNLIAYKGGKLEAQAGESVVLSIHAGHGFVNGTEIEHDYLPNRVGDIIEIPRTEVDPDPNAACSIGLHVGTWDYASSFAEGAVMTVEVDPADVVSVPADYNSQKVRVCRYKVTDIVKDQLDEVVFNNGCYDDNSDDDFEIPDEFTAIDYITEYGETRYYDNPTIEEVNNDNILIVTDEGEYRTLLKSGVTFVNDEPEFEIPNEFSAIEYTSESGNTHRYESPVIVANNKNTLLIKTDDDEFRTLKKSGITFDYNVDESKFTLADMLGDVLTDYKKKLDTSTFNAIRYVTQDGDEKVYQNPTIVVTPDDEPSGNYLIKLEDGTYRSLNPGGVEFLNL